ncbi:MAG: UDP-N-acetylmuramoyl-L-alanine--D-glutamate ligase [Nitrospiraceae bacterium]|nr:UDP-N-acetylmuramoyl-L-alanine--D-glutamate ligase [Nitrospiraceae bacterium]
MRKKYLDKKIVVVGMARSGIGAANLLAQMGAKVTLNDKKHSDECSSAAAALDSRIKLEFEGHPEELFASADLIVVSPGVPLDIPAIKTAANKGVEVIGELELGYEILCSGASGPQFFAVTGSNGKSTTTTLLYEMMRASGFRTMICGNIGNAITEEILTAAASIEGEDIYEKIEKLSATVQRVVVEVSSFQLEAISSFRPKGSVILNITQDHMDRYHGMQLYKDAKLRVFMNQSEGDLVVLNADDRHTEDAGLMLMQKSARGARVAKVLFFSRKKEVKGAFLDGDIIRFNAYGDSSFVLKPEELGIKGVHNIENAMAASLLALAAGCSTSAVESAARSFQGLEHRLEFVKEIDGVRYINDSKGTNVGAVIKSLEGFSEKVILIAGGRDKDSDFTELRPYVEGRVKAVIVIGEAADKISNALKGSTEIVHVSSLADALSRARGIASKGEVVLLSPACASFDMFRDFEDRGRQFKEIVRSM